MGIVKYKYPADSNNCLYLSERFYEKFLQEIEKGMHGWKGLSGWSLERKVEAIKMRQAVNIENEYLLRKSKLKT